jgi:transcriptional regulator with XRE-family HTH domain
MVTEWSALIVAQMHLKGITGKKLAELTGYTPVHISMILNGKKNYEKAKWKIERAINNFEGGKA